MAEKKKQPANVKAQIAGGPRQKLMQVMRASGVPDAAANKLTTKALGSAPKKQPKSLRRQIIGKLREIGAKARARFKPKKKKKATPRAQPKR